MRKIFFALFILAIGCAPGRGEIVTDAVDFVSTSTISRDGNVYITRSGADLILYDAGASTTTLSSIGAGVTDHGALSGLSDDDHSIYLNTTRHSSTHDATFNNALAITGDVGGQVTLGAHVADTNVHYIRNANLYEVYQDGTGPYPTIQDAITSAIADAPSKAVIFIGEGQYNETITMPGPGEPATYLVGYGREATRIYSSQSGGAVVSCSSGNSTFINLTIENTATGDAASKAINCPSASGIIVIENCLIKNASAAYHAIAGGTLGYDLTIRNSEIRGGYRLISGDYDLYAYNTTFNRVANRSEETFTISSTSRWQFYNCSHIGAFNKGTFGTSSIDGGFTFGAAGGSLWLLGLEQTGGCELKLFQDSTSAGNIYVTATNYDDIGGASNITVNNYKLGQTDFSERVKIYQSDSTVPLQIERETAQTGNYINITDEDDDLLAALGDDGYWTPNQPVWSTVDDSTTATYWLSPWAIWAWESGSQGITPSDWATETSPSVDLEVANIDSNRVGFDLSGARWDKITELRMQYRYGDSDPLRVRMGIGEYTGVATTQYSAYGTTTTTSAIQDQRFDITDISRDAGAAYWGWLQVDCAVDDTLNVYRIGVVYSAE